MATMKADPETFFLHPWDFNNKNDSIGKWFLMGSPFPVLLIAVSYLFFVLWCGPKFMKGRPAYNLKNVLLIYNAFQVAFACYIAYIGIEFMIAHGVIESKHCFLDDEKLKYRILRGIHIYFIAKLTELLDTIFFVLRKKWNQVTFLHVYHHFLMFSASYICLKYEPTFSVAFLGTLNSFVHIIMYTYYGLSAFPNLHKYLWWKKYITKMQLIQFLLLLILTTWNFIVTPCRPSYILISIVWSNVFLFTYLFSDFYIKSYHMKRKDDKDDTIKDS